MTEFVITVPKGINGDQYRAMLKRWRQWGPIKQRVQAVYLKYQRRIYAAKPVGDMDNLGPKILAGDYVASRTKSVTVGVRSEYAGYYSAWRESKGLGPLLEAPDKMIDEIVDVIEAYVLLGLGATEARRRRRKK